MTEPCCPLQVGRPNRESAMVVLDGLALPSGKPIWCDPCLVPLVRALNEGGMTTIASCCGHGHMAPSVILDDDTWLVRMSREQADRFYEQFPFDINGDPRPLSNETRQG